MGENNNQLQEERRLPEEIEGTLLLNLSDTQQERLNTLLTEYKNFAAPYIARGQHERAQAVQSGDRTALARNNELLKALNECRQRTLTLQKEISTEGEIVSESVVNQIAAIEEHFSVLRTLLSELDEVTKDQAAVAQVNQQYNVEAIRKRTVVFPGWVKYSTFDDACFTHLAIARNTLELDHVPGRVPIEQRAEVAQRSLLEKMKLSPEGDNKPRGVTIESADEAQMLKTVCDEVLRRISIAQSNLIVRGKPADPRVEKQYAEVRALREQLTQVENTFNSPLLDTLKIIDGIEGRIDLKLSQKKQSFTEEIQSRMSTITRAISSFNFDHGWIDARVGGLHRKSAVLWLDSHDYSNEFNKAYPPGGLCEAYEFSSLPGQDEPIALSVWRNAFMIDEKKWLEFKAKINAQMSGHVSIDAQRQNVGARVQRAATPPVPDFADAHGDDFDTELRHDLHSVPTPDDDPLAGWLDDVEQSPLPRQAEPPKPSRPTPAQPGPRPAPEPLPPDAEEISFRPLFETLTPGVREAGRRHREALATPGVPAKPAPEPISKRQHSQFFTPPPGDLQDPDIPDLLKRVEKLERTQGAGAKSDEVNKLFEEPAATAGEASAEAPNPDASQSEEPKKTDSHPDNPDSPHDSHAHAPEKSGDHDARAHAEPHDDHHDSHEAHAPKLTRAQQMARDLLKNRKKATPPDSAETSAAPKSPPVVIRNPLAPRSAPKAAAASKKPKSAPAAAPARTAPVNAADAPKQTILPRSKKERYKLSYNDIKFGFNREFFTSDLMKEVLTKGALYVERAQKSKLAATPLRKTHVLAAFGNNHLKDLELRKDLDVTAQVGSGVFEEMSRDRIFELVALRRTVVPKESKEIQVKKTGGFLGFGGALSPVEETTVVADKPAVHHEVYKDGLGLHNGITEPAYSIIYCVSDRDYKHQFGRKFDQYTFELVLPESVARQLFEELQKDPYIIRQIMDVELEVMGLQERSLNGRPRGTNSDFGNGPEYVYGKGAEGPTKIYFSPEPSADFDPKKWKLNRKNIREI